ncbi:hypothetical protein Tco_1362022 [Tanacetum coccineum]
MQSLSPHGLRDERCVSAKETWAKLVHNFKGLSDTKENRIMDLKLEYQTFRGLRNDNHTQTLDLADIYGRFVYEDNLIQRRYSDTKNDFQENSNDEVDERSSKEYLRDLDIEYYERALLANSKRFIKRRNNFSGQKANENTECYKCGNKVAEIFDWDEEEVSDKEEVTQVKVLMALADGELNVGRSHARNGERVKITIRKVNTLLSMDEDADWQNYLKCRDEMIILKQAKLDAVTFQIQNNELTNEQIPQQKKKVLGGELLTESLSKININENAFIPASMGRILVPESQAVNEFESTETLNTPEPSNDSEAEFLTLLPPLKNLQGASPSLEDSSNKSVSRTATVSETKQTTPSVPTKVKDTEQE